MIGDMTLNLEKNKIKVYGLEFHEKNKQNSMKRINK
jgi:hypothetical protein